MSNLSKNSKWDVVLSNMHQPPKNFKLDFIVGMKAEDFLLLIDRDKSSMPDYYINFTSDFSINNQYYDTEVNDHHEKLKFLIGKKIISAEFAKERRGDIKLVFNSGDELIIHERDHDVPYESYTMQTPEGLVVV